MSRNLLLITADIDLSIHVTSFLPPEFHLTVTPDVAVARTFLLHADEPDPDEAPPRLGEWVIAYGSDVVEDHYYGLAKDAPLDPAWGSTLVIAIAPVTLGAFQATQAFPASRVITLPGDAGWRHLLRELVRPPAVTCELQVSWPS